LDQSGTKIAVRQDEVASAHLILWICSVLSTEAAKNSVQTARILLFFGAMASQEELSRASGSLLSVQSAGIGNTRACRPGASAMVVGARMLVFCQTVVRQRDDAACSFATACVPFFFRSAGWMRILLAGVAFFEKLTDVG
jgi:hypothetical protein